MVVNDSLNWPLPCLSKGAQTIEAYKKIYLIRHTETEWNEQFRYIGRTDLPLSELGIQHADMMSKWFADVRLDAIYASPMVRARETAGALAADRELPVEKVNGLREIDFGVWEGLTHSEILERDRDNFNRWLTDPENQPIPEGDLWSSFEARVGQAFTQVTSERAPESIAIVSHGGPIKVIVGQLLGIPAANYWQIYLDKGSISALVRDERGLRVTLLNDTCYLRG